MVSITGSGVCSVFEKKFHRADVSEHGGSMERKLM
jgi:hypothetical protein